MIQITVNTANGVHTIQGPGFYAITSPGANGLPQLIDCRYINGQALVPERQGETLWISDAATLSAFTGIAVDAQADAGRELELFIRVLYVIGVELGSVANTFDLHSGMSADNRVPALLSANLYDSIEVFDFMAMTGAILYPFNRLAPNAIRPVVADAQMGDDTVMKSVIQTLGIAPYAVHIFGEYGISVETLFEILRAYDPLTSQQARQIFYFSYIVPVLRQKGFRLLTSQDYATITA